MLKLDELIISQIPRITHILRSCKANKFWRPPKIKMNMTLQGPYSMN